MLETYNCLVLSTGHITHTCSLWLTDQSKRGNNGVMCREYGFFLRLPIRSLCSSETIPSSLIHIELLTDTLDNIGLVELDCDGEKTDKLPTYDW